MNPIGRAYWTAKGVGWENLPRRLLQAWRVRTGWLGRQLDPARFTADAFAREVNLDPAAQPRRWANRASYFPGPTPQQLNQLADDVTWAESTGQLCQNLLAGRYPMFSHDSADLGWPPEFNRDPVHDIDWPVGQHWTTFARSGPPRHDIKLVWEPSRLTIAYHLARQFIRTDDDQWARAWWQMFDAWLEQNPPQLSAAWACGQEITFRLMAAIFAAVHTCNSPHATPEQLLAVTRLAWQSGLHIEANINYARSQGNNHAISEAVGLLTIGLLFDELPRAGRWRTIGAKILAAECRRQIYDDGSYVQNSTNYHRVMMDDILWALGLCRRCDVALPQAILDRFARATDWLAEMIDPESGRVPNYGANDGANVLPLSCCDYLDYRPTLQAAACILGRKPYFPPGPWDEKAFWLTGQVPQKRSFHHPAPSDQHTSVSLSNPKSQNRNPKSAVALPDGGYYILRGPNSWAMTRCHTYRHRPSQADMLHLDLWAGGQNILRDAGSYMYYCDEPLKSYFPSTAAHNTVEIDGPDQMTKGPRFLWFHWTRSRLLEFSDTGQTGRFVGEHYGYTRLPGSPVHRRTIERNGDCWTITDEILGRGEHEIALRWRLIDADWTQQGSTFTAHSAGPGVAITIDAPANAQPQLDSADESLFYAERSRHPMLTYCFRQMLPVTCTTQAVIEAQDL